MNRTLSHIPKYSQRYFFVFAVIILILFSCPVKSSIKTLAGIPTNTERNLNLSNNTIYSSLEKCENSETANSKVSQEISFKTISLLPAGLLTANFAFLLESIQIKPLSHPLYKRLKIAGTLPIFLQYQKLII